MRHGDVDPQGVDRRQAEQLLRRPTGARIDERPDIRPPRRDHAVERHVDLLEGLDLLEPADIGGIGVDRGLHSMVAPDELVGFLLGHGVGLQEGLPAVRRDFGGR